MKIVLIMIAILLPLLTSAGNCECDECLDYCRCGNASSSQACKDCVAECEPKNDDCSNFYGILSIIAHVVWAIGLIWKCVKGSKMTKTSCLYKHGCKLILTILFLPGVFGFIYFVSCDCDDPWGCSKYYGELTCPSFGGDKCKWTGDECTNTIDGCVCCTVDITNETKTILEAIVGVEAVTGILGAIWSMYECCKDTKEVQHDHYREMDDY